MCDLKLLASAQALPIESKLVEALVLVPVAVALLKQVLVGHSGVLGAETANQGQRNRAKKALLQTALTLRVTQQRLRCSIPKKSGFAVTVLRLVTTRACASREHAASACS